jgi:hypothetical protein
MKPFSRFLLLSTLTSTSALIASPARADAAVTPTHTMPSGLRLDLSVGATVVSTVGAAPGAATDHATGGLSFGAALERRYGHLVLGGNADIAVSYQDGSDNFAGVHVGYVSHHGSMEWAVLPEGGAHAVIGVGRHQLDSSDNLTILPYAGLKLGLLQDRGPGRVDFGLWLFARADLDHETIYVPAAPATPGLTAYNVGGLTTGLTFRAQFGS